ncbi:MAG: DinB family protein [Fuerstiella sp.]
MDLSQRPGDHECFDFHRDYVGQVPDGNILDTLNEQSQTVPEFIANLPAEQLEIVHAPFGWKIRTVVEHCCDAERVFGYRVLRFAAGDMTELPGWDENHYAGSGYGDATGTQQLADEFRNSRKSNLALLRRLRSSAFDEIGVADGRRMSVRAITWLMAGHWLHHEKILIKRLGG